MSSFPQDIAAPLGTGPLEPDYSAAIAEETRSHDDVLDESDLAPTSDETLERPRDRRSNREQLMSDLGLREADFR